MRDDTWRHRRKWSLARTDIVRWRGSIAKSVAGARNGEVVHLVVHDDTGLRDHKFTAEIEIDSGGERDGQAITVNRGYVRRSWSG